MRALLMAGVVAAVAGSAAADVVGNFEFGTDFTNPNEEPFVLTFSSLEFQAFRFSNCGGGFCDSQFAVQGSDALDVSINWSMNGFPMFLEGQDLASGTVGDSFPLIIVTGGVSGDERRNYSQVPFNTPFFFAFKDEQGRDGFVQAEYYLDSDPSSSEERYRLLGWAIELEPSNNAFFTFDVRNGIPAPTTAGLLGLAGIAATRRRR